MRSVLITGPVLEPVNLADMKTYLKIDGTEEDDLIASLITSARLMVEASVRKLLISQTWRIVLDDWPRDGILRLPLAPVIDVTAVRVYDSLGVATPVASTLYAIDKISDPPRLMITGAVPSPGQTMQGIEIDVTAGYGTQAAAVPAPLRQAIRMLASYWFENRGEAMTPGDLTLPADILVLMAPYRRTRL